jgi:transposase
MDDNSCRFFFTRPTDDTQRLYEALRAVFVGGCQQKDAAERFGLSFDAFRQQVRQFRLGCDAGTPPPFSPHARAVVRRQHP